MTMAPSALARDLEDLHDRLQVAPPPRVARRVRALIHEALGLLTEHAGASDFLAYRASAPNDGARSALFTRARDPLARRSRCGIR